MTLSLGAEGISYLQPHEWEFNLTQVETNSGASLSTAVAIGSHFL